MCGQSDNGDVRAGLLLFLADDRCCLQPAQLGHLHVHEDEVEGFRWAVQGRQRFTTVDCDYDGVSLLPENGRGQFLIHGVVFGQQDSQSATFAR